MISNEQLAALDALAKEVISGMPEVSEDDDKPMDKWFDSVRRYAEMVQAANMLPLIAELMELRRNRPNTTGEFHYDGY